MDIAANRLNQLHDLLHYVNAPPMTEGATKGVVMEPHTEPQPPALVAQTHIFFVQGNFKQLPKWMENKAKKIAMAKVHKSPYFKKHSPHTIAGQLTMTLRNRQLKKEHPRHLVKVTFRAVPKLYGQPRYDNVRVKLGDTNGVKHMYFARYCSCTTFTIMFPVHVTQDVNRKSCPNVPRNVLRNVVRNEHFNNTSRYIYILRHTYVLQVRRFLQKQHWRILCPGTVVHRSWELPSRARFQVTALALG